jgi:hypothetical protein
MMETWQKVWRDGVAPNLSTRSLETLRGALERNDRALLQGTATFPPPLEALKNHVVEGACAVGYCGWQGDGLETVAEVEEFFARVCFETDRRLGEPAASRWFLNWFDETPRPEMRRQLLAEVNETLAQRAAAAQAERAASAPSSAA